jgi:hypothetical protein
MNLTRDMRLTRAAMKGTGLVPNSAKYIRCLEVVAFLSRQTASGAAYDAVHCHNLCGVRANDASQTHRQQRATRRRRAKQIRRELWPQLQEAKLVPMGSIWLVLLTSPTVWTFLFNWVRGILADREGA